MSNPPLRIVTFNFLPIAFDAVAAWIHKHGHKHLLAVTTPGPLSRPTPRYIGIVEKAPRDLDILVTTRLKTVVTPVLEALKPDLIVSFSFPYRIPPSIFNLPTYGSVNLHPAALPAYRGPNVMRAFYDGAPEFGATLHWIDEDFDTGRILSRQVAPMPDHPTIENVMPTWVHLTALAIEEGIEKALAGDPGELQDHSQASYAAPYTEEERWINWLEPTAVIQRKLMGLNIVTPGFARARIGENGFAVIGSDVVEGLNRSAEPGSVLEEDDTSVVVKTGDGAIRLTLGPTE